MPTSYGGGFGQPSFGSGYQAGPVPGTPTNGFSWGGLINSPLAPAIVQLLGGIIGGIGQGKEAGAQRAEQRRQFDTSAALQEKQFAADEDTRQRRNAALDSTAPMRAAIMQAMAQRLGVTLPPPGQSPGPGPGQVPKPAPIPMPLQPLGSQAYTDANQQKQTQLQGLRDAKGLQDPAQIAAIRARLHDLF